MLSWLHASPPASLHTLPVAWSLGRGLGHGILLPPPPPGQVYPRATSGLALSAQPPVLWCDLGLPLSGSPVTCGVKSSRWAFLTYTSLSTALSGGMQSQAPSP